MANNFLRVINETDAWRCNCVKWARLRRPDLPFGLWTIGDKQKIIKTRIPHKNAVAIMRVGLPWGHVGIVKKVDGRQILIREANFKMCKVTERYGTEAELKIIGYFE
jgi:hypothetical protein